jgi:hypothetical protein
MCRVSRWSGVTDLFSQYVSVAKRCEHAMGGKKVYRRPFFLLGMSDGILRTKVVRNFGKFAPPSKILPTGRGGGMSINQPS